MTKRHLSMEFWSLRGGGAVVGCRIEFSDHDRASAFNDRLIELVKELAIEHRVDGEGATAAKEET